MRIVERAVVKPARCAVLPFIGGDRGPFIDTGSELPGLGDQWDQHVYVSEIAVRQMAVMFGWSSPDEVAVKDARIAELEARVAGLEEELEKADVVLGAIDTLESRDFRARKKPGRKPSQQQKETV